MSRAKDFRKFNGKRFELRVEFHGSRGKATIRNRKTASNIAKAYRKKGYNARITKTLGRRESTVRVYKSTTKSKRGRR